MGFPTNASSIFDFISNLVRSLNKNFLAIWSPSGPCVFQWRLKLCWKWKLCRGGFNCCFCGSSLNWRSVKRKIFESTFELKLKFKTFMHKKFSQFSYFFINPVEKLSNICIDNTWVSLAVWIRFRWYDSSYHPITVFFLKT